MKFINIILGIATLVIMVALINLGILTFTAEPKTPEHPSRLKPMPYREFNCAAGDQKCTDERNAFYEAQAKDEAEWNKQFAAYEDALESYNKDFFVIANVIGILIFVGGFFMLFKTALTSYGVSLGVMSAGLAEIVYGYMRGWRSTSDPLKFFVGLFVAALVIGGSTWLLERFARGKKTDTSHF